MSTTCINDLQLWAAESALYLRSVYSIKTAFLIHTERVPG